MSQVTVAIPTTGRANFLRTALNSVQKQISVDAIGEIIVSENGNDRRTEDVVREFPNLPSRYLFRKPTLPMAAHWFSTLRQAKTPYIAVLNDDDWWNAGHLADGLRELNTNADSVAYAAASLFVSGEGYKNPRWIDRSSAIWLMADQPSWLTTWSLVPQCMVSLCWAYTPFHVSSLVVRTDALLSVLDEFERNPPNDYTLDRLLFARLALRGTFRYNPSADTYVRWHDANLVKTRSAETLRKLVQSTVASVEQIAAELGCSPIETWKSKLVSIPRETESEVLERLNEAFTMDDLRRFGLAGLFHERRRSPRLMALRSIASNTKRLLLGSS